MGSASGIFRSDSPTVGDRVVVRRLLDDTPGHLSDVIGHVESVDPLVVRPQSVGGLRSSAPALNIPAEQIKVIKVLSPRRIRNSDIREVEHATARAFPGIEHSWVGPWLLRAGDGVTERSNSAAPLGPNAAFSEVPLREIRAFYRRHGLPARILIPERIGNAAISAIAAEIDDDGHPRWKLGPEIIVMTRELRAEDAASMSASLAASLAEDHSDITFEISDQPDQEWLSLYHFRGTPLPHHALNLLRERISGRMGFGRLRTRTGETIAITRGTLTRGEFEDRGRDELLGPGLYLGYSAVEVAPAWRRRGLGTRLGAEMLSWGASLGADQAYLQVIASNQAGISLYRRLGFSEHHRHRYAVEKDPAL